MLVNQKKELQWRLPRPPKWPKAYKRLLFYILLGPRYRWTPNPKPLNPN